MDARRLHVAVHVPVGHAGLEHGGRPLLRSTIVAVSFYEGTPDWEVVKRKVDITSRKIPGLRQHVVTPPLGLGNPRWVYDPHFDLSYHLRRVAATSPGRIEDVLIMARTMGMQSFDKDRPLWEVTVVEASKAAARLSSARFITP